MKNHVFCTILTPTYNRMDLLKRLYASLCEQDNNDFEWLVIDDGSTDQTEKMIEDLKKKTEKFNIVYRKTENGGKHRAINYGVDYANGEVIAIVDSDDYLTPNAIQKIKEYFEDIAKQNKKFAGVAAQKGYSTEEAVGTTSKINAIDAKNTERKKYGIEGDKFEIFYTEVLKNNKFPEIENEKFMTEALLWTRIANQGYYLRWYNDILYICEYLPGGLTDSREKLVEQSPLGYALFIKEQVKFGNISWKQKLGYYSFYYKIRRKTASLKDIAKELETNQMIIYLAFLIRKMLKR